MALSQLAILSSRAADQYWLRASENDVVAADYVSNSALPAGFGDCLLLEVGIVLSGISTIVDPANKGYLCWLQDVSGAIQDIVGVGQMYACGAAAANGMILPSQIRFWKRNENIGIQVPDVESAGPTGDIQLFCLVRRLVT